MWILQNIYNEHCFCLISEKKKYTVGRLGADIELSNDNSISRAHAIIHVECPQPNGPVQLVLQDVGSKYGTFYNKSIEKNENLAKDERIQLKAADVIRFGRFKNIWKIQKCKVNVITSSLTRAELGEINELIKHLDGNVLQQWTTDCTHLTMNEPSITVKLLQALIEQKEVVNMNYWRNLLKSARGGMFKMIKPELYRPRFWENFDLNHNNSRRFLFKGHTIVFLHRKHYDMYESIVRAAGGCCKDLNSGVQKSFLLKSNTIVIQYTPSTQTQSSQTINCIADYLQSHSKRIIPEYELGLAILHCSTERYCNPSFITPSVQADDCIDLTDNLDVEYTIPETNPNTMEPSLNISVTETPVERDDNSSVKRKHSDVIKVPSSDSDEDDENLFQIAKKMRNLHSTKQPAQTNTTNKSQQQQQSNTAAEALSQEKFTKSNNMEKKKSSNTREANETNKKQSRKRPLIPVLSNDNDNDEDDVNNGLFDFGDKTNSSEYKTKRIRQQFTNNSDDELFAFNDNHNQETINLNEEDSNDMKSTQEYIPANPIKRVRKEIHVMPKPKILPSKVNVADWLSCSLNSMKIKSDNTTMESDDGIKLERDCKEELRSEEDQEWLEALKNAVVIRPIAATKYNKKTDKSHYKYKSSCDDSLGHASGGVINFKPFVKKYQPPPQRGVAVIHLHSRII